MSKTFRFLCQLFAPKPKPSIPPSSEECSDGLIALVLRHSVLLAAPENEKSALERERQVLAMLKSGTGIKGLPRSQWQSAAMLNREVQ